MNRHPNATIALGSASGLGALAAWAIQSLGGHMTPEAGAAIAGGISFLVLAVGRVGLIGIWQALLYGNKAEPPPKL